MPISDLCPGNAGAMWVVEGFDMTVVTRNAVCAIGLGRIFHKAGGTSDTGINLGYQRPHRDQTG